MEPSNATSTSPPNDQTGCSHQSSNEESNVVMFFSYTCITCLCPSPLLYKQYSSAKNIKLETCSKCSHDVDPYIERELLLVLMDMILLRRTAYRHFFFNRSHALYENGSQQGFGTGRAVSSKAVLGMYSLQNILIGTFASVLLRVSLKLQDVPDEQSANDFQGIMYPLLSASLVEFLSQWVVTMATAYACILPHTFGKSLPLLFWKQLHLAIISPQLFHVITLLVHIYENSFMVRGLGSLVVPCFGYLSIITVMERWLYHFKWKQQENTDEIKNEMEKVNLSIASSFPFLLGLFFELFVSTRVSRDRPVNQVVETISTIFAN